MDFFQVNFCSPLLFGTRNRGFWHAELLVLLGSDGDRGGSSTVMPTPTSEEEDEEGPYWVQTSSCASPQLHRLCSINATGAGIRHLFLSICPAPYPSPSSSSSHPLPRTSETGGKTLPAAGLCGLTGFAQGLLLTIRCENDRRMKEERIIARSVKTGEGMFSSTTAGAGN